MHLFNEIKIFLNVLLLK